MYVNTSAAVWSESALFAEAILLATLLYEILGHLPYSATTNMSLEAWNNGWLDEVL